MKSLNPGDVFYVEQPRRIVVRRLRVARTGDPIGMATVTPERIDIAGEVSWFIPLLLDRLAMYWEGYCAPHVTPQWQVEDTLAAVMA